MSERLPRAENEWDLPEFSFEAGVEEATARILKLFEGKPLVTIAFSGSSSHVGKTTFFRALSKNLSEHGVRAYSYKGLNDVGKFREEDWDTDKLAFVFEQMEWDSVAEDRLERTKIRHDKEVREALQKIGKEVQGVDLWIGIYRPDIPFATKMQSGDLARPIADFLVRNEHARDKNL